MIGSLWDLKHNGVDAVDYVYTTYHDRFPMGFETFEGLSNTVSMLAIMIGSLWDLKPAGINAGLPLFLTIMIGSLWDLKH